MRALLICHMLLRYVARLLPGVTRRVDIDMLLLILRYATTSALRLRRHIMLRYDIRRYAMMLMSALVTLLSMAERHSR